MSEKKIIFDEKFKEVPKPAAWFGVRHEQYFLLLSAIVAIYGMRTAFNVAIIAMVSDDPPNDSIPTYPEWTSQKNVMLSSFSWGYVCLQLIGAQLAKKYGPKLFLGISVFVSALLTIFLPLTGDKLGYQGVIANRAIQGLSQGFIFPCLHNMLGAWAPINERAKAGNLVYTGCALGTVVAMPVAGEMCASSLGWTSVFYLYGCLGLAWTLTWVLLGSNTPSDHKRISDEERRYIESGKPGTLEKVEDVPTPWVSIFTSLPFLAIVIADAGNNLGFFTLLTELPSYMETILKFNIASNSFLSALPYFVSWLVGFVMSSIADALVVRQIVSRVASRKIFSSIGLFVPALALLALNFVDSTQKELTIFLLVIAVGVNTAVCSGFLINHIDLSPVHAGSLMGITNTISNIFGIIAPLEVDVVKSITGYEETDKSLWNIIFSLTAVVYLIAQGFYILLASAEIQPWNNLETDSRDNSKSESEKEKKKDVS